MAEARRMRDRTLDPWARWHHQQRAGRHADAGHPWRDADQTLADDLPCLARERHAF